MIFFDIEVFKNYWLICLHDAKKKNKIEVDSNTVNYQHILKEYIGAEVLVGFNIKNYDLKVLNAIMHKPVATSDVYFLSKSIIAGDLSHGYNTYDFWNKYNFCDLMDDYAGSLKEFESNTFMSIEEYSKGFEDLIEDSDIQHIKNYCWYDVDATENLFKARKNYIKSKCDISKMFNFNLNECLKATNAGLVAKILKPSNNQLNSNLKFIIPANVKEYVNKYVPAEVIKGFTSKPVTELGLDKTDKNDMFHPTKKFNIFDNKVKFGVGGIHSVLDTNIQVHSDNDYLVCNWDVTSYYPNLIMKYDYMSRNVKDRLIYEKIYKDRVAYKKAKNAMEKALKLILNTTYGAMKNKYNKLFDPYMASNICILGQLLLCALANELYIAGATVIQTNTDGVMVKIKRSDLNEYQSIVDKWEQITMLGMERDDVVSMYQKDVNNYIETSLDKDNKLQYKVKGKWCNQYEGYTGTNLNATITHKAIINYYTKNIPVETTINNCNCIEKFIFTCKRGSTYLKTIHKINDMDVEVNRVNRVVAVKDTNFGTLYKYKEDETGKARYDKIAEIPANLKTVNDDISKFNISEIDKLFYINFAKDKLKILKTI